VQDITKKNRIFGYLLEEKEKCLVICVFNWQ